MNKTQPEFADIIGENVSNLKTYERTEVLPKVHIRKRIAEIAGVSVRDLLEKDLSEKDIKLKVEKDEKNVPAQQETAQKSTDGNQTHKSTDKLTTSTKAPAFEMKHSNGSSDKDATIHNQSESVKTLALTNQSQQEVINKLTDLVTKLVKK